MILDRGPGFDSPLSPLFLKFLPHTENLDNLFKINDTFVDSMFLIFEFVYVFIRDSGLVV